MPLLFELGGSDPEGDSVQFLISDHPEHGMLGGRPPRYIYHPDPGFTGSDRFRVVASDGVNQSMPATVEITVAGTALLSWSFDDTSETQDLSSDQNATDMLAATLSAGPGINSTADHLSFSDAAPASSINSSSLDVDDYYAFILEPVTGKAAALERLAFSVFDRNQDPFDVALRFSFDGFSTWRTLPVQLSSELRGFGQSFSDGSYCFADCSDIAELQAVSAPVEFRIYLWNADRGGIGKTGLGYSDITVSGSTADAPSPAALAMVSESVEPLSVGQTIQQPLIAQGGTAPYTWTVVSGTLPDGLSLSADGVVSGTPVAVTSQDVIIRVQDSASALVDRSFLLAVTAPDSLSAVVAVALTGNGYQLLPEQPAVPGNGSN